MSESMTSHIEPLLNALSNGDRLEVRLCMRRILEAQPDGEEVVEKIIWPALCKVQQLHRDDEMTRLSFQYATRLMAQIIHQMQQHYDPTAFNGLRVLLVAGDNFGDELSAQLACDLLEAAGYEVLYCGGGVANDEIVAELANRDIDRLVIFGTDAQTLPSTRCLIDRLHDIGACPTLQIVVGGGVFNRAEGLAEEIGADVWTNDPVDLVRIMVECPDDRMVQNQRTVGKRRRAA